MTWQITLFNWTGYTVIIAALFTILSCFVYWVWNRWIQSSQFMWRYSIIAYYKTYGSEKGITNFKEKNGKTYKIVEVQEKEKGDTKDV